MGRQLHVTLVVFAFGHQGVEVFNELRILVPPQRRFFKPCIERRALFYLGYHPVLDETQIRMQVGIGGQLLVAPELNPLLRIDLHVRHETEHLKIKVIGLVYAADEIFLRRYHGVASRLEMRIKGLYNFYPQEPAAEHISIVVSFSVGKDNHFSMQRINNRRR